MPVIWEQYERRHSVLDDRPRITKTSDGHPGDPVNMRLVGSEEQLKAIMLAAKWFVADPLGVRSDFEIGADTILKRTYGPLGCKDPSSSASRKSSPKMMLIVPPGEAFPWKSNIVIESIVSFRKTSCAGRVDLPILVNASNWIEDNDSKANCTESST